jgi:signal transduction histidine kinase
MDKQRENLNAADKKSEEIIEDKRAVQIADPSKNSVAGKDTELAASQVGYQDLFDNMPNGCVYYKVLLDEAEDPVDLVYIKVNSAYGRNIGRALSELIGNRVTAVFQELTGEGFPCMETYLNVALFGEPVNFTQYFDQQDKWYSISAYSPQPGYVVEISEDITEQKRAEGERRERERQVALIERVASLGALSAGVAHEINQPLQALKIMADSMIYWYDKGKETSVEKVIESCRKISVQAGYIASIVEWMQDSVNKAWSDVPEEVDVKKMIKQVLILVQERLRAHGIQLRENSCAASLVVWGDSRRLEEIVIIILVNAIDSFVCVDQGAREIRITTSCGEDRAVIEISNNGPAIPDDIIGKIFEPFFSSSKSGTKLGMGLAIVKSVVNAHNGTIQVFSSNQQVTFRIEFPLYRQSV